MDFGDTIYALSSGALPSGVAVVRVSGKSASTIADVMAGGGLRPRTAELRSIRGGDGRLLDRGLCMFFPAPRSFTGEDCLELHVHGGRAVVGAVLEAIGMFAGARAAEAGEFTRRAFLNGRMDLVEAEALADLIAAETEMQRQVALASAGGLQSKTYAGWRRRIVHSIAMIEAELDFADEGDVPGSLAGEVWADISTLIGEIRDHIGSFHRSEIIRDGFRVVILGPPNAGKSSLLNALARRDVAIVTDEPGTTRDLIDVALDLDGVKVVLTDTAGIRDDPGIVEGIGIERALDRAREADLVIRLVPVGVEVPDLENSGFINQLVVRSKCDLFERPLAEGATELRISVVTGEGMSELVDAIAAKAAVAAGSGTDILPARLRHVELLKRAIVSLSAAIDGDPAWLELRAEELRSAAKAFGAIAGEIGVEDVLDAVFSEFCIGK